MPRRIPIKVARPTANSLTVHGLEKFQGSFRDSPWPKWPNFGQKYFSFVFDRGDITATENSNQGS